ncbi:peptidase M24B/ X-Pro dipeptidase/aminopeptidase-like domain protein [Synechococcus sp. BIOS-E4-1]|nr:peptidase M24B/ X-Pro dipeptidase/aminopeptidase-like domain protein [Synechococcus sp. BIOS-E4-1]
MWQEKGHGIGLIKPGQVPEITVLAEGPLRIGVVSDQGRRWNHCSGLTQFCHEPLTAIREQLSIKNRGEISHDRDRAPEKRQDGSQSVRA